MAVELRDFLVLPRYPADPELLRGCARLGIRVELRDNLPKGLDAINVWAEHGQPVIYLRRGLPNSRAETSLCHELREIIENALRRFVLGYEGLDTSDNQHMNAESDQFAGCFLMPAEPCRRHLQLLGFDIVRFSTIRDRSLSSVIVRLQELFPKSLPKIGPVAGIWLFEAPWDLVEGGVAKPSDARFAYSAHLCGFSARARGPMAARQAWLNFPRPGSSATDYAFAAEAIQLARPVVHEPISLDLFGDLQFTVSAEPIFARGTLWQVLMVAVRGDYLHMVEPWLRRLRAQSVSEAGASAAAS